MQLRHQIFTYFFLGDSTVKQLHKKKCWELAFSSCMTLPKLFNIFNPKSVLIYQVGMIITPISLVML